LATWEQFSSEDPLNLRAVEQILLPAEAQERVFTPVLLAWAQHEPRVGGLENPCI